MLLAYIRHQLPLANTAGLGAEVSLSYLYSFPGPPQIRTPRRAGESQKDSSVRFYPLATKGYVTLLRSLRCARAREDSSRRQILHLTLSLCT